MKIDAIYITKFNNIYFNQNKAKLTLDNADHNTPFSINLIQKERFFYQEFNSIKNFECKYFVSSYGTYRSIAFGLYKGGKSGQRRVPHHLTDGVARRRDTESVTENNRLVCQGKGENER